MKVKFLERGIVYSEIEYELRESDIEEDKKLSSIVKKHKAGKMLTTGEELYLYERVNYIGKVTNSEILEYPEEYTLEELQDYEE